MKAECDSCCDKNEREIFENFDPEVNRQDSCELCYDLGTDNSLLSRIIRETDYEQILSPLYNATIQFDKNITSFNIPASSITNFDLSRKFHSPEFLLTVQLRC